MSAHRHPTTSQYPVEDHTGVVQVRSETIQQSHLPVLDTYRNFLTKPSIEVLLVLRALRTFEFAAYRNEKNAAPGEQEGQLDCGGRFIVFEVEHYHHERPHQGMDDAVMVNSKTASETPDDCEAPIKLVCKERLGGVLK
ncbi:hypothetical protein [Schlesneria sp.]|uniref:hypothetical protein n=1 Tax=Schlesneria sp. TaxID=2762018 RepID=UPI002EFC51E0